MTQKINYIKGEIDRLNQKLEKKEEERKLQNRGKAAEMDAFGDEEDVQDEEIIDEEELVMLKELKDMKRDYRENYSKLKGFKQELASLQANIDTSKEQLIYQFETWYSEEFETGAIGEVN